MIVTTQNAKCGLSTSLLQPACSPGLIQLLIALGETVPEVDLDGLGPLHLGTFDKTLFSMATPEVLSMLQRYSIKTIVLMGIEVS